jgi:hypothetical protein
LKLKERNGGRTDGRTDGQTDRQTDGQRRDSGTASKTIISEN